MRGSGRVLGAGRGDDLRADRDEVVEVLRVPAQHMAFQVALREVRQARRAARIVGRSRGHDVIQQFHRAVEVGGSSTAPISLSVCRTEVAENRLPFRMRVSGGFGERGDHLDRGAQRRRIGGAHGVGEQRESGRRVRPALVPVGGLRGAVAHIRAAADIRFPPRGVEYGEVPRSFRMIRRSHCHCLLGRGDRTLTVLG
ncbi:hypothetical protein [Streptomyces malaysiensis]|uniref:hypothetical protein n=1 Tax=Streptomyces malaysiensis TaxID=92644 RepID=UPI002B31567F|nr:hypothetical protein R8789_01600 [Streptomyces malaysiensis]